MRPVRCRDEPQGLDLSRTDDPDRDLVTGLLQATRFLEGVIATYHCQWLNFYWFWSSEATEGGGAEAIKTAASQV